jgi:hypothetical protein
MSANRPERTLTRFRLGAGHDPLLPLRFEKSCRPTLKLSHRPTAQQLGGRLERPVSRFISIHHFRPFVHHLHALYSENREVR